jgi:Fe-S-cluster containining protein
MKASIEQRLEALYVRLPAVETPCPPGCRDCCGPIPMTRTEWTRIEKARPNAVLPRLLDDGTYIAVEQAVVGGQLVQRCPFLRAQGDQGSCSVYALRPLACRMYAASSQMECPRGCASASPLTSAEHRAIIAAYHRIQRDDR